MKSQLMRDAPASIVSYVRKARMATPMRVAASSTYREARDTACLRATAPLALSVPGPSPVASIAAILLVLLAVAAHDNGRRDVEDEGYEEERQADGEDGLVVDGAAGGIAQPHLEHIPRHGLDALEREEGQVRRGAGGDRDDHRFADHAGDGEQHGGDDTGQR